MQDLTYHYDGFSNLDARIDNQRNLQETFTYDHLNRLTGIWLGDTETGRMDYDAYGRMEHKTADGRLVFTNAVYDETTRPHAIDRADTFDGVFSEQSVTYTCFDKVKTITQGNNTLEYIYGYDRQRIFMEEHTDHGDRAKRYVGNCELLTETTPDGTVERWLTCLVGPTGAFAMVETDDKGNHTLHYILKDNLGSWNVITDKYGNLEQELSFDAWGDLRNPETWRAWSDVPEPMFDRGFTGHEHLYAFGLINMNGRMYDPQMSCFLSVDAYVQSPENAQGFNRYAYCLNNPLRYTDPSGWLPLGPMPGNPFHDNWSKNFVEPVYEPRDLGLEQLTDYEAIWMQGNEVHGGGGDNGHGGKGGWVKDKNGIHYDVNATTDTKGFQGITYESGNIYYGLLGDIYDLDTEQGRFWKDVYNAFIKYVDDSRNNGPWKPDVDPSSTVDFSDVCPRIKRGKNIHQYENNDPLLSKKDVLGIFTPCEVNASIGNHAMRASFGSWNTAYPGYNTTHFTDDPVPIKSLAGLFPKGYTLCFSHNNFAIAYVHFLNKESREYMKKHYCRVFGYTYKPNRP